MVNYIMTFVEEKAQSKTIDNIRIIVKAFGKSHYEKLRKVISIWICFHGSKEKLNTINSYNIKEKQLYGGYVAKNEEYDLIEVITLYIGDDNETSNQLLKMLDKIYSSSYNVEENTSIHMFNSF